MSVPILTFFNNKGGVGKTSLAYHLAWMFSMMGKRVLSVDLDPQANLTAAFLDEEQLIIIWQDKQDDANTIFRCIKPLLATSDIRSAEQVSITSNLSLIPGDLALSNFEDELSEQWPKSMDDKNLERPFRIVTAFWQVIQEAAIAHEADFIITDVGPNLGAINRSALVASDFVVIPLGADLFSLQGLRNLGPTLRNWRTAWKRRLENWNQTHVESATSPAFSLPQGNMEPIGYIAQQHGILLTRPVKAYDRWLNKIPAEYRQSVLASDASHPPSVNEDPLCLAQLKHYRSLAPMAMEARKPIFSLKAADGAIGSHSYAVREVFRDYQQLAQNILKHIEA